MHNKHNPPCAPGPVYSLSGKFGGPLIKCAAHSVPFEHVAHPSLSNTKFSFSISTVAIGIERGPSFRTVIKDVQGTHCVSFKTL